jgi:GntR family transcriptional repressor for pyruvate dehydrogenase complex
MTTETKSNIQIDDTYTMNVIKKKKGEFVVDEMVALIASGRLKPGDKLPSETILAENFGVSRVTIRESFKKLTMMGIVQIRHGEGTFVSKISLDSFMKPLFSLIAFEEKSIEEIYDARLFVESGIANLAAKNRTDSDLENINALKHTMTKAVENNELEQYSNLDTEFHICIGRASKNTILLSTYMTVNDIIKGYIGMTNKTYDIIIESMKEHNILIDAIIAKQYELAGIVMKEHILASKTRLLKNLTRETL